MKESFVVALDVIETVFSLDRLAASMREAGLPESAPPLFFAQMLRDAFALEASGVYKPFREIASANLAIAMANNRLTADSKAIGRILAAFAELEPHPDVKPALARLREASVRVMALSNGAAENTRKLFTRAGLDPFVEKFVSIDEVRRWKPNREVYLHAARSMGVEPARMVLVAAHAWDVHGAKQAGLRAAWIRRKDQVFHAAMSAADVQGETLTEVVDALVNA